MAQTLINVTVHIIFSTKNRADLIAPEIESELYAYVVGILRKHESVLLAANGTANHVHLLFSLSKKIALSDLLHEVKKSSSQWMTEKGFHDFQWQAGFAAFSVSQLQLQTVKNYIAKQKEKHQTENFENEFRKFLQHHEIEFDERFVWD